MTHLRTDSHFTPLALSSMCAQAWRMSFTTTIRSLLPAPWRLRRAGPAVAAALMALAGAQPAFAARGEWRAAANAGVAAGTRLMWGPALGVQLGYGVSESLDVQLAALGSWHPARANRDSTGLVRVFPEVVYRFDVLRWVPWVGAGGGYFAAFGAGDDEHGITAGGSAGLDYLWSRQWAFGVMYRADWCFGGPARPVHQALLRLEWRSGW